MSSLRFAIAYLIAPLALPTIEYRLWELRPLYYELFVIPVYCAVGSLGTLLFGIPIYVFLSNRKWTAFWVAPIAGFIVGGLTWSLVGVALIVLFSFSPSFSAASVYPEWLQGVLWPYGPLGAVVASLLWVMAWMERAGRKAKADER
jgi:hypothetical protein